MGGLALAEKSSSVDGQGVTITMARLRASTERQITRSGFGSIIDEFVRRWFAVVGREVPLEEAQGLCGSPEGPAAILDVGYVALDSFVLGWFFRPLNWFGHDHGHKRLGE